MSSGSMVQELTEKEKAELNSSLNPFRNSCRQALWIIGSHIRNEKNLRDQIKRLEEERDQAKTKLAEVSQVVTKVNNFISSVKEHLL